MFHSDERTVGGRDLLVDGMLMHQWKLKHAAPTLDSFHKPSFQVPKSPRRQDTESPRKLDQARPQETVKYRQVLDMRRRVAQTKACVDVRTPNPGLSQRMSYNKQLHADLEAQTHRTNIIHMQRRMRAYKPPKTMTHIRADTVSSPRAKKMSQKGGSIVDHVRYVSKTLDNVPTISSAAGVKDRFFSSSPRKLKQRLAPSNDSSIEELWVHLDEYMKRCRMTVTDFFRTSDSCGNGGISAFRLREILQAEQLGFNQRQITSIIRSVDSEEDGTINPIGFEEILRRVRWGQQAMRRTESYKSPRGANAEPIGNHGKKTVPFPSDKKIELLFHPEESSSYITDPEVKLRKNLIHVIVKRRLYRSSDLEDLFRHVLMNAPSGSEQMTQRAIQCVRAEMDI